MEASVIIPTLNEQEYVEDAILAANVAGASETVVSDGGSTDETVAISRRHCTVIEAPKGRARQMNAGAAVATGEVLLFVHADTLLPPNAIRSVREALRDPICIGGCFRLKFDAHTPLLDLYAASTRLSIKSWCFGDRVHFMRRKTFDAVGGYPDQPVFEDLEMVRRLTRHGSFRIIPQAVTTSARRFLSRGTLRQQLLNTYLWTRFHLGTSPDRLARLYKYGPERD